MQTAIPIDRVLPCIHIIIILSDNYNHVAELFHVDTSSGNIVQIFGYLPPKKDGKQIKWVLSVQEDLHSGAVDTFPTFQPTEKREVRSALHEGVYIQLLESYTRQYVDSA